jgi:K+-sensing histidine kinase KdpD
MACDMVTSQVEMMGQMVSNMLEGAGAASGKVELRKEPVVLQDLIRAAVGTCQPSADRRRQDIEMLMPADPVHWRRTAARAPLW